MLFEFGKELKDGEPCGHPGCLSHVSHPCEGCGRVGGRSKSFRETVEGWAAFVPERYLFHPDAWKQFKEDAMPFKTTPEDVTHMFTYHPPKEDQIPKYEELRKAAEEFAQTILRLTPGCPDQTVAIRKVREAVMTANAAIALEK